MKISVNLSASILLILATGCGRAPERPEATLVEPVDAVVEEAVVREPTDPTDTYVVDPDSEFTFTGYYVAGKQTGGFLVFDGHWHMAGEDPETARFDLIFFTDSVYSSDDRLTRVLVGEHFFDAMNHPEGLFESSRIRRTEDGFLMTGNLTLRDVAKSISFPARIDVEDGIVRMQAAFQVDRNWWELGLGGIGDYALRDRVDIVIDMTAHKE